MIKKLTPIVLLCFAACSGSGIKDRSTKDSLAVPEKMDTVQNHESDIKVISGTGEGMLTEIGRPSALYYGKSVKTTFNKLTQRSKEELSILLAQIKNHGGAIAGSMAYIYQSIPLQGDLQVFIGIQVKAKMDGIELGEFYELPAGRYYKMKVNAEPGETWEQHKTIQKTLITEQRKVQLPILEIFSETYNSNMTPITKATLFYSAKPQR